MSTEADLEVVRDIYAAWNEGNVDRMIEFWVSDDDWHWEDPPHFPDARTIRGREEVKAHLRELMRLLGEMEVEVSDMEAVGDEIVADVNVSFEGAQSGIHMEVPTYAVILFDGGRIRRYRVFGEREDALQAAAAATG